MPTPKEIFDNPLQHLDFLQSDGFEGQFFDRKEIRVDTRNQINTLKAGIVECISAFANSNRAGGLLVLGIADDGTLKGTQHVNEQMMNNILQVMRDLTNHATQTQDVNLPDSGGKRLHLLYTPWAPDAICETVADFPKAWKRVGAQCLPLRRIDADQLRRDKRVIDFEQSYCGPYKVADLDESVVEEFKRAFLEARGAQYDYSTEEILLNIGALMERAPGEYAFTKAGYLFFASYPRKYLPGAFVRVLRFEVDVKESRNRGATTFDKDFDGALPNIIRNLRIFFRDSAIFRTIIRRSIHGGFVEDPEYPLLAVDEALVNAVIHKDYGFSEAVHCIAYRDGFVVVNPGSIPQEVPQHFSLADTVLNSVLRNPRIVEWMQLMKDERGEPLVRALSEGTRKMRQEMEGLGLPAPDYQTARDTTVTLYNRFAERLAPHAAYTTKPKQDMPHEPGGIKKVLRSIGERLAKME